MLPAPESSFRCFNCDYDLRGLNDGSVRCPECGQQSTRGVFDAHLLTLESLAMQYAANAGFLCYPILYGVLLTLAVPNPIFLIFLLAFVAVWLNQLRKFVLISRWGFRKFFAFIALQIAFVLCGIVSLLCVPCIFGIASFTIEPSREPISGSTFLGLITMMASGTIVFGIVFATFRWAASIHRRLRGMVRRQLIGERNRD